MSEVMNVKLTRKTLLETQWHLAIDEEAGEETIPSGRESTFDFKPDKQFTEVWVSKQLPFVLLARMETGEFFIYDHLRYNKNIPYHMAHFFQKWNRDHGFETAQ